MHENIRAYIDKLIAEKRLDRSEWICIFESFDDGDRAYAASAARKISMERFGNRIYTRGLIEFSNVCKNDCLYCGIRRSNRHVERYRLTDAQIMECCEAGYGLGYRTFVLQSGEDAAYPAERIGEIVGKIKKQYPDCAVTLSLGEREREEYAVMRAAGADRYLLRQETADRCHYEKLHPREMSFRHRMQCLETLKDLGFQTGAGIMVGFPFQTAACLAEDMEFFRSFKPHMIGIGPFLPQKDTPFGKMPAGSYPLTLLLLSLIRIMLPDVLLPATTALGTIRPEGREEGILAGANVIMPNLSPGAVRKNYMLYDHKICTEDSSADCKSCIEARLRSIGYTAITARGDYQEKA